MHDLQIAEREKNKEKAGTLLKRLSGVIA